MDVGAITAAMEGSPFGNIPCDLRDRIFRYAAYEPHSVDLATEPAILLVCKQMRKEAEPGYYEANTFHIFNGRFPLPVTCRMWVDAIKFHATRIGHANAMSINNLKILFGLYDADVQRLRFGGHHNVEWPGLVSLLLEDFALSANVDLCLALDNPNPAAAVGHRLLAIELRLGDRERSLQSVKTAVNFAQRDDNMENWDFEADAKFVAGFLQLRRLVESMPERV